MRLLYPEENSMCAAQAQPPLPAPTLAPEWSLRVFDAVTVFLDTLWVKKDPEMVKVRKAYRRFSDAYALVELSQQQHAGLYLQLYIGSSRYVEERTFKAPKSARRSMVRFGRHAIEFLENCISHAGNPDGTKVKSLLKDLEDVHNHFNALNREVTCYIIEDVAHMGEYQNLLGLAHTLIAAADAMSCKVVPAQQQDKLIL
jgi:hypothetical protein